MTGRWRRGLVCATQLLAIVLYLGLVAWFGAWMVLLVLTWIGR